MTRKFQTNNVKATNKMKETHVALLAALLLAPLAPLRAADATPATTYEELAKTSWKLVPWCGYDFVFQP